MARRDPRLNDGATEDAPTTGPTAAPRILRRRRRRRRRSPSSEFGAITLNDSLRRAGWLSQGPHIGKIIKWRRRCAAAKAAVYPYLPADAPQPRINVEIDELVALWKVVYETTALQ